MSLAALRDSDKEKAMKRMILCSAIVLAAILLGPVSSAQARGRTAVVADRTVVVAETRTYFTLTGTILTTDVSGGVLAVGTGVGGRKARTVRMTLASDAVAFRSDGQSLVPIALADLACGDLIAVTGHYKSNSGTRKLIADRIDVLSAPMSSIPQ